jgi:hypothetical protein
VFASFFNLQTQKLKMLTFAPQSGISVFLGKNFVSQNSSKRAKETVDKTQISCPRGFRGALRESKGN